MRMADSFDPENAMAVDYEARPKLTASELRMARAMSVVRMRLKGYTFGVIARFHGIGRTSAHRIFVETPDHVRRRCSEVLDDATVG